MSVFEYRMSQGGGGRQVVVGLGWRNQRRGLLNLGDAGGIKVRKCKPQRTLRGLGR